MSRLRFDRRHLLLGAALLAGLGAGVLYHASAQRVPVVVAARDLDATRPLGAGDLATRQLPVDALPTGALRDEVALIGRHVRAPLASGQLLLAGSIRDGAAQFSSGLRPPTGYRAVAIPVTAAHALGGAVVAGARVNVVAVPLAGRAPAERGPELVASAALVLDVRTESGEPLIRATGATSGMGSGRSTLADRLGSVVIAIPPSHELALAQRIPVSTFVLTLAGQ